MELGFEPHFPYLKDDSIRVDSKADNSVDGQSTLEEARRPGPAALSDQAGSHGMSGQSIYVSPVYGGSHGAASPEEASRPPRHSHRWEILHVHSWGSVPSHQCKYFVGAEIHAEAEANWGLRDCHLQLGCGRAGPQTTHCRARPGT